MTNEITKNLMCIQMRSGVEIWMEQERAEKLQVVLQEITGSKFIRFDDQTINTADVVGVFSAANMADHTRRKNGEWKCQSNIWHQRGEKCNCLSLSEKQYLQKRSALIASCGACTNGYLKTGNSMIICTCVRDLQQDYAR